MATTTKTWQMYIGGAWVDSSRGEAEPNIDPSTESVADEVQIGTRDDADRAVEAAQKAFDEVWFDTPPKERSAMLFKLADAIDADAENLACSRRRTSASRSRSRAPTSRSSATTSVSSRAPRATWRGSRRASTRRGSRA